MKMFKKLLVATVAVMSLSSAASYADNINTQPNHSSMLGSTSFHTTINSQSQVQHGLKN